MSGKRFYNFKVIWRKESNRDNAFYVNIVKCDCNQQQIELQPKKDNEKSLKYRNDGNKEFVKKNWCEALRLYNKSLCFAEIGTESLALAYANRSACFLHIKKFEQCLVDIDLAEKAHYPLRLMSKLEKRKNDCLKQIEKVGQFVSLQPKLDFEPNKKYPSMAYFLEIKRNDTFGRYITTKEDIEVGKTVMVEKSYMTRPTSDEAIRCNICLRSQTNLVPCKQCTTSLFCVGECETHFLHRFECCMKTDDDNVINDGFMEVVRSILIAINTIPNVDNLIQFVEQTIAAEPMKIPEREPVDSLSKYRVFLELSFPQSRETYKLFNCRIYMIYNAVLKHPEVAAIFFSKGHKRFLKHLIAHHDAVIQYNCQSSYELGGNKRKTNLLPLIASNLNHSCAPNIATLSFDGFEIAIVVRPIKRGEQLFISYLGLDAWSLCGHGSRKSRQKYLVKSYGFLCSCLRCSLRSMTSHANSFDSDESYRFATENYHPRFASVFSEEKAKNLLEKCAELMRKYGRQEWTDEMSLVMLCYVHMLSLTYQKT